MRTLLRFLLLLSLLSLRAEDLSYPQYNFKLTVKDGDNGLYYRDLTLDTDSIKDGMLFAKRGWLFQFAIIVNEKLPKSLVPGTPEFKTFLEHNETSRGFQILESHNGVFKNRPATFVLMSEKEHNVFCIIFEDSKFRYRLIFSDEGSNSLHDDPRYDLRRDPDIKAILDSFTFLVDNPPPPAPSPTPNPNPAPVVIAPASPPVPKAYPLADQHCSLQIPSDWPVQPFAGYVFYGYDPTKQKAVGLQVAASPEGADLNNAAYVQKWQNDLTAQGYTFSSQQFKTLNGTPVLYTQGQRKNGDKIRSFAMLLVLAHQQNYVLRVSVDGETLPGDDLQAILNSFQITP